MSRRKNHQRRRWRVAYVAFGGNRGDVCAAIEAALGDLQRCGGARVAAVSPLYRTAPVGGPRQPDFLNGVARVRTRLSSLALMSLLLALERKAGRRRRERWGPRELDLDLLSFGRSVRRSRALTIPHPRYHERRFVLAPFCDIAPRFVHPVLRSTNRTLFRKLTLPGQRVTMAARWRNARYQPFRRKRTPANRSSR